MPSTCLKKVAKHPLHQHSRSTEALELHNQLQILGSSIHKLAALLGPERNAELLSDCIAETSPGRHASCKYTSCTPR